jgi:hypothetical protein
MCDVDGTGEASVEVADPLDIKEHISIKVEEAIDITDGIPEAVTCAPIKTELEVRLWGVFEVVAGHPCIPPKRNYEITLFNCTVLCYIVGAIYLR